MKRQSRTVGQFVGDHCGVMGLCTSVTCVGARCTQRYEKVAGEPQPRSQDVDGIWVLTNTRQAIRDLSQRVIW